MEIQQTLSWRKKIKYMQMFCLILIVIWYFAYNKAVEMYHNYGNKISELNNVKVDVLSKQNEMKDIKRKIDYLNDIQDNYTGFVYAYNSCYSYYIEKMYNVWTGNIVSLNSCIYNNGFKKDYILELKDIDIQKIAILFWVYHDDSLKFTFDQKKLLYSLDQNIFFDDLEKKVPILTLSQPILIDAKLRLYKINFTISINKIKYNQLKNYIRQLQNKLFEKWDIYYTLNSISSFNIMNVNDPQNVNLQWTFYFYR